MVPSMYGWHLLDFRIKLVGLDVVLANLWCHFSCHGASSGLTIVLLGNL